MRSGSTSASISLIVSRPRHRLRGRPVVAGQHDNAQADRRAALAAPPAHCRLDGIGNAEKAGEIAVDCEKDHGRAVATQALGISCRETAVTPTFGEKLVVPERNLTAVDCADHAFAGRGVEIGHLGERDTALGRRGNDRRRQRMFARALDARCEPQHFSFTAARGRNDGDDLRLAFGQSPGLVDDEGIDFLHTLQSLGALDQDACLRAASDADHD